jgi:hypothetical protein
MARSRAIFNMIKSLCKDLKHWTATVLLVINSENLSKDWNSGQADDMLLYQVYLLELPALFHLVNGSAEHDILNITRPYHSEAAFGVGSSA